MEFVVKGDASGGPKLTLDHEQFSYAGKFVMTNTGKVVAREEGEVVAAVSFNRDRSDETCVWLRYITVREDRRGDDVGAELAHVTASRLLNTFDRVRIAVNNPFAYEALYKAGFGYTGEQTGIAELVLERPIDRSREMYLDGYNAFDERELSPEEQSFIATKTDGTPPGRITR